MRSDEAIDQLVASAQDRVTQAGGKTEIFAAAEGQMIELDQPAVCMTYAPTSL